MENQASKNRKTQKSAKMSVKRTNGREPNAQKPVFGPDERKAELLGCFQGGDASVKAIAAPLISEMVYLEGNLAHIKTLPLLLVDKNDLTKQQQTPAALLYSRLASRYADTVAKLVRMLRVEDTAEESPLRTYLKSLDV